jgi:sterol desaturase/sphingolipid hydroxylase (fatty acid hydroxylase superfamily)
MDGDMIMICAIGGFVLLMLAEFIWGLVKRRKLYRLNDTVTNLNIGVGSQVFGLLYQAVILAAFFWVYDNFAIFHIPVNIWTVLVIAVGYDFLFYWAHRWGHEMNIFWGAHVVHHQSEEYNLSVALRQPWFHSLLAFFIFLPLPLLGFDPLAVLGYSLFSTLYQFYIHTKAIGKMPRWFEFLFNTPSHHRVHHAVNEKYIDRNHGAVLIIWDRLFGTFAAEEEEPTYGITTPFRSFNPVWSNFHYYFEMWERMKTMHWKDKVKMIFARPGWTPGGPPPAELIRQVDLRREKFDTPPTPLGLNVYVFAQFILIMAAAVGYIAFFEELGAFARWYFAGLMILSMTICSGIFERKKWVFFAEYARLMMVAASLNIFYYVHYIDWFVIMAVGSIAGLVIFYTWFSISLGMNYRKLMTPGRFKIDG